MTSEIRKESESSTASTSTKMRARRLKGHNDAVTCCISSRDQPGIVVSSGEDGRVCLFDLRCKDVVSLIEVGKNPVTCICYKGENEDIIYASSGTEIKSFDIRVPSSWKYMVSYNYNKDEINQITFNKKSNFLAAADDSGDVKIIDTQHQCMFKSLRNVHTNICSTVQFLSWKPWSVITGGLDLKLAMWDFSKGHALNVMDYGSPGPNSHKTFNNPGQSFNPPCVHSIAIPEVEKSDVNRICAVARGDGVVDVMDVESELGTMKHRNKYSENSKAMKLSDGDVNKTSPIKRLQLDSTLGGHNAAVSSVCFSTFGEKGRLIISGGNDAIVKVWDWTKHFDTEQESSNNVMCSNIDVRKKVVGLPNLLSGGPFQFQAIAFLVDLRSKRKVNWVCTTSSDSENLIVCDTGKEIKLYTLS